MWLSPAPWPSWKPTSPRSPLITPCWLTCKYYTTASSFFTVTVGSITKHAPLDDLSLHNHHIERGPKVRWMTPVTDFMKAIFSCWYLPCHSILKKSPNMERFLKFTVHPLVQTIKEEWQGEDCTCVLCCRSGLFNLRSLQRQSVSSVDDSQRHASPVISTFGLHVSGGKLEHSTICSWLLVF